MDSRIINTYMFLILSVYLLAVPFGGYEVISGFKFILFSALTLPFIILSAARSYKGLKKITMMQAAAMLYFLFSIISALLSDFGALTVIGADRYEGLLSVFLYVFLFITLSVNLKAAKWQLYVFGASVTLMCIIILLQLAGLNPLGLYPSGISYMDSNVLYSGKYAGTIGNAGLTAAILSTAAVLFTLAVIRLGGWLWLMLLPALLACLVLGRLDISSGNLALLAALVMALPAAVSDLNKLIRLLIVYPLITAVWFYDRLSLLLFILIVLFYLAALLLYKFKPHIKRIRLYTWITLFLLLMLTLIYVCLYKGSQYGTIYEANRLMHGVWNDDFGNGRLFIWREVWSLVKQKPLFGGGPDTLGLRGLPYYLWYSGATPVHSYITAAHNEYLNVLVNQGIFAALCYIALPVMALIKLYRSKKESVIIASGAALCYSVVALFGISMCASAAFYWILLAYSDNRN